MISKTLTVESFAVDPYFNLALEQWLLEHLEEHQCILYLWQNENTVVIGKNQNAWKECQIEQLKKNQGKLARRLSGGGAVYHDLGNLNFTFLVNKEDYDVHRQLRVIQQALHSLGVDALISGRNDLCVGDRKISGNAFLKREKQCYHHGTLLVNTDKEKMQKFLNPSKLKLASKGVDSVRSRTANLKEFSVGLTIDELKGALRIAFNQEYGVSKKMELNEKQIEEIHQLKEHYASDKWNYNMSQEADFQVEKRFSWGEVLLLIKKEKERIKTVQIFTDSMETEVFIKLAKKLEGIEVTLTSISKVIEEMMKKEEDSKVILLDILSLFVQEEKNGTL